MNEHERVNASIVNRIVEIDRPEACAGTCQNQGIRLVEEPTPEVRALEPAEIHRFIGF